MEPADEDGLNNAELRSELFLGRFMYELNYHFNRAGRSGETCVFITVTFSSRLRPLAPLHILPLSPVPPPPREPR